jgi:hypothetical protein
MPTTRPAALHKAAIGSRQKVNSKVQARNMKKTGSDLFIVDNSDEEWKVLNYLSAWSGQRDGHRTHAPRLL